eukprot:9264578-Pyramimonas_sp.AAC.1
MARGIANPEPRSQRDTSKMSVTGYPSWRSSQDLKKSSHTASTTKLKSRGLSVPPARMDRPHDA